MIVVERDEVKYIVYNDGSISRGYNASNIVLFNNELALIVNEEPNREAKLIDKQGNIIDTFDFVACHSQYIIVKKNKEEKKFNVFNVSESYIIDRDGNISECFETVNSGTSEEENSIVVKLPDEQQLYRYRSFNGKLSEGFHKAIPYVLGQGVVQREEGGVYQYRDLEGGLSEEFAYCRSYDRVAQLAIVQKKKNGSYQLRDLDGGLSEEFYSVSTFFTYNENNMEPFKYNNAFIFVQKVKDGPWYVRDKKGLMIKINGRFDCPKPLGELFDYFEMYKNGEATVYQLPDEFIVDHYDEILEIEKLRCEESIKNCLIVEQIYIEEDGFRAIKQYLDFKMQQHQESVKNDEDKDINRRNKFKQDEKAKLEALKKIESNIPIF